MWHKPPCVVCKHSTDAFDYEEHNYYCDDCLSEREDSKLVLENFVCRRCKCPQSHSVFLNGLRFADRICGNPACGRIYEQTDAQFLASVHIEFFETEVA